MRYFLIFCVTVFMLSAASCREVDTSPDPFREYTAKPLIKKSDQAIGESSVNIKEQADQIQESADHIKSETQQVETKVPSEAKPSVKPHLNAIDGHADDVKTKAERIKALTIELNQVRENLSEATHQISDMEDAVRDSRNKLVKANEKIEEAEEREQAATTKLLRWLIVICLVVGGVSVAIGVFGHPIIGMGLGASAISTAALATTFIKYLDIIAYAGLAVLGISAVIIVWQLFVRDKALEESVDTTEAAKQSLPPAARRKLFGYGAEKGLVDSMQSSWTRSLVAKKRQRLKKAYEHTIDTPAAREQDMFEHSLHHG